MKHCEFQVVLGSSIVLVSIGGYFYVHLLPIHAFVLLMTTGRVPQQFLATPASCAGCSGANRVDQSLFGLFLLYPITPVDPYESPVCR